MFYNQNKPSAYLFDKLYSRFNIKQFDENVHRTETSNQKLLRVKIDFRTQLWKSATTCNQWRHDYAFHETALPRDLLDGGTYSSKAKKLLFKRHFNKKYAYFTSLKQIFFICYCCLSASENANKAYYWPRGSWKFEPLLTHHFFLPSGKSIRYIPSIFRTFRSNTIYLHGSPNQSYSGPDFLRTSKNKKQNRIKIPAVLFTYCRHTQMTNKPINTSEDLHTNYG